jgi:hypothetical protein
MEIWGEEKNQAKILIYFGARDKDIVSVVSDTYDPICIVGVKDASSFI